MTHVTTGLEIALSQPDPQWKHARLGLLTNPSGVNSTLESSIDLMHRHPDINLVALFGPEHGVRGNAQAGDAIEDELDSRTGLPAFSLYGPTRTPSDAMLDLVEVMLIDIQDIGVRFATYFSCVADLLTACDKKDIPVVVLDRPNPLGGTEVAGNILEAEFESYVGIHSIPIRHGLTIGEFGRLWAKDRSLAAPEVIAMAGWTRSSFFDETNLPWVQLSPNLPTIDSSIAYPATCLLEGANLSEGRGTTRPFELLGAPWINAYDLADSLNSLAMPGVIFRPACFVPTFSKHRGLPCHGVQIHVTDRTMFRPVTLGPHILATVKRLYPDEFAWLPPGDRYFVDLLSGSAKLRLAIDDATPLDSLLSSWQADSQTFRALRTDILLYE